MWFHILILPAGSVSVNDSVEIASLGETRKVKSMQMFKKPVTKAVQGDRIGMCVTQFDSKAGRDSSTF